RGEGEEGEGFFLAYLRACAMSLWSWMGGPWLVDYVHGEGPLPLSTATTLFNLLQALTNSSGVSGDSSTHSYGVLMDAAFALLILSLARYACRLLTETWPSWISEKLRNFLAMDTTEDAAAVDVFMNQPEEFVFDNELLVLAIERYVSHLLECEKEAKQDGTTTDNANNERTVKVPDRLLRTAEYCYRPDAPMAGCRMSAAETLRSNFRLVMRPVDGDVVEVEPGLTVCFQQQLVPVSALRECKLVARRGPKPLMDVFIPLNFDAARRGHAFKRTQNKEEHEVTGRGRVDSDGTTSTTASNHDGSRSLNEMRDPSNATGDGKEVDRVVVQQAILRCTDKSEAGKERVMAFARRAYAWYIPIVAEPAERYYFVPSASEWRHALGVWAQQPSECSQCLHMRRFVLSTNGCGFRNLFFRQKAELLALLEDFKQKQGKFVLPGVAHQLVVLLHGMPGTGKSSVARSIAMFLNRHIVAVPIGLIQTDSTLRGILSGGVVMIDGATSEEGEDGDMAQTMPSQPQKLDVDRVVYVFEDVEAMAGVLSFPLPVPHQHLPRGSEDTAAEEEEEEEEATAGDSGSKTGSDLGRADSESQAESTDCRFSVGALKKYRRLLASDFLSPEGVLTALDATLAPSGRVIVFTTNYPEKLPELFWKPGVVTLAIHLGALAAASAMELVEHYCSAPLTPSLRARFAALFSACEAKAATEAMNPAALLHLLTVCDRAEEVLAELQRFC
ncbi:putative bcs1 aaa-type ATPase, partial [Trypanosoma conorhini]